MQPIVELFLHWHTYRFEEDQMNRVARKRMKRSGRGVSDGLNEVTDFSGLDTLLDHQVRSLLTD